MPIEPGEGDLVTADVDAIVNTVNTVGVMGKGLALQIKNPYLTCSRSTRGREGRLGGSGTDAHGASLISPLFVINFPTRTLASSI